MGNLKPQITDANQKFGRAETEVVPVIQTGNNVQCETQKNIPHVVGKFQLYLPLLEMYSNLKGQMSGEKKVLFYPKNYKQLERVHVPQGGQYWLCQLMTRNLPKLFKDIKEIPLSDLKDFQKHLKTFQQDKQNSNKTYNNRKLSVLP